MKKTLLAAVFAGFLPTLGHAADPASGFTDAQRKEIVAIVRQALKADPSILRDAVSSLEADNQAKDAAEAKGAIAANQKALFNQFGDPQAGNPNGDVTVVEFYDPRCPYCRRMLPGIAQMLKKDPGVRLVFKDIPVLGPASVMESRAILAAQAQGAYLKMQTALMTNPAQPSGDDSGDRDQAWPGREQAAGGHEKPGRDAAAGRQSQACPCPERPRHAELRGRGAAHSGRCRYRTAGRRGEQGAQAFLSPPADFGSFAACHARRATLAVWTRDGAADTSGLHSTDAGIAGFPFSQFSPHSGENDALIRSSWRV